MNEKHPEGPGTEPGTSQERAAGAGDASGQPPFRRLRSGRRRLEATAPLDAGDDGTERAAGSGSHALTGEAADGPASTPASGTDPRPETGPANPDPEPAEDGVAESWAAESDPADPDADPADAQVPPQPGLPPRAHHHAHVLEAHPPADGQPGPSPVPAEQSDEDGEHEDPESDPTTAFLLNGGRTTPGLRKRRRRRRNIIMVVMVALFAVVLAGAVILLQNLLGMATPEDYAGPGEGQVTFTVEPGWGPLQIGGHLTDEGIVADKQLFVDAIQQVDSEKKEIHPGDYELKYKMRAVDAATILVGEAAEKVNYVAVKQNVRTDGVFDEITKATGIPYEDLEALNKKPSEFGLKAPVTTLEGFLHPGEYRFPLDASAHDVLQMMVDATTKELTSQGVTDPADQYRALKIASILQAEASPKDYKTVSGALDNRLRPDNKETDGLLQVDSSVIYGLKRYTLQLTKQEKEDASNPYNSYKHRGLPPTPIGSPADKAIEAAIHPDKNGYYYWVTVNTKTGETKFAKTYKQHQVYQNEFRTWCKANEDVCK